MKSDEFELLIDYISKNERSHIINQYTDFEELTTEQNIRILTEVGHMIETEKKRLIKG